jgi:ubiquinone/menaquinone biosynthesis C-methylase UbiE
MPPREAQKRRAIEAHSRQAHKFASAYAALEDGFASCFAYSRRRLDEQLARQLPSRGDGVRLLDVGCGTGHHLAALRARWFSVAGADGSEEMVHRARANNPGVEIARAEVEELPFADGSFEYVLCIEVLRYLPSPVGCLREMARVLKPDGVCLATATPFLNLNGYWLVNRLATLLPMPRMVRLKQFFTTSSKLRRDLHTAGFSTVDIHGVYLGPINWVERLAPKALPRVLRAWEPYDSALADRAVLRELSNMFVVRAEVGGE